MSDAALTAPETLVDRALKRVTGLWRDMADYVARREEPLPVAEQMAECLAARGGEVSARARDDGLPGLVVGFWLPGARA